MQRPDPPYLYPELPAQEALPRSTEFRAAAGELSTKRLILHLVLLLLTAVTTTLTGMAQSVTVTESPDTFWDALMAPFVAGFRQAAAGDYGPLLNGVLFTVTLLAILGAHEMGHYLACRRYGVAATLPFFIPAPPLFTPFGTFGAVIRIKSPIPTRRALFDIGLSGPLAGFALALPASVIGLLMVEPVAPERIQAGGILFHDPPLFQLIIWLFGLPKWFEWNPVYWAAWGALLVTALNLFPVGQLDGGHTVYAVFGRRVHKWVSRIVTVAVGVLAVVSIALYDSPVWFVWTLVLVFLLRAGHPPVYEDEPLGKARIALAVAGLIVFLLCFMPFPITIAG